MQCRNCGTEIADKAIVCYRCGHATTDPVRKAAPVSGRRSSPLFWMVAAVLLLLAGLSAVYVAPTAADPERWQAVGGVLAGAAAMVIVLGLLRRRR
jgi:hypothetical protein